MARLERYRSGTREHNISEFTGEQITDPFLQLILETSRSNIAPKIIGFTKGNVN